MSDEEDRPVLEVRQEKKKVEEEKEEQQWRDVSAESSISNVLDEPLL